MAEPAVVSEPEPKPEPKPFAFERDEKGVAKQVRATALAECKPGEIIEVELRDQPGRLRVQSLLYCAQGEGVILNEFFFPDGPRPAICANQGLRLPTFPVFE